MTQDIECTPGNDCKNVDQGPHNQNKSNTLPIEKVVTEETQAKQTLRVSEKIVFNRYSTAYEHEGPREKN